MHKRTISARSGGCQPAVFVGNARARMTTPGFTQLRHTRTKSGGYQPAVARQAHLQRRYRTCSVDGRRCVGARYCNRVAVTTGGLRPHSCSRDVRQPTELRLLRCTNAHAAGAAGVSPPWDRETHSDRRFHNCSAHCRPVCWRTPLQSRSCNHGGLTPPALVPAKMRLCSAKVAFSPANERHTQEPRT